jgi:hypothetical protein
VDEGGIGVWSVTAAGEDVEDRDRVTSSEPVGDGDRKRKSRVVAMRRENEDLQVRLQTASLLFYWEMVAGLGPVGDEGVAILKLDAFFHRLPDELVDLKGEARRKAIGEHPLDELARVESHVVGGALRAWRLNKRRA